MKVTVPVESIATIEGECIPVGTVFLGNIINSSVYLRTFTGIVDLKNPSDTWTLTHRSPTVSNYEEVDAELTVKRRNAQ